MNKNDQNIAFKMVYFVDESGPKWKNRLPLLNQYVEGM
jgi:hypothetical protein